MAAPSPILFTIPNFITAGSGRAMLNIIERLDRKRFAPGVCVSKKGGDLDTLVDRLGIPFLEADFTVPPRPYLTLVARAWKRVANSAAFGLLCGIRSTIRTIILSRLLPGCLAQGLGFTQKRIWVGVAEPGTCGRDLR